METSTITSRGNAYMETEEKHKARQTILTQLSNRGYKVVDNSLQAQFADNVTVYSEDKSAPPIQVVFFLNKLKSLDAPGGPLTDKLKNSADEVIIIVNTEPSEGIQTYLKKLWDDKGKYVVVIGIKYLQYNVLKHSLVPPHRALSQEEASAIYARYGITDPYAQLPNISRFDKPAEAIGLRPGQLCEIRRPSTTAVTAVVFRICSNS
jgi:DNA-directed RNA polymerase subunit H